MFGKNKEPMSFKEVVSERYKTDTIMSTLATLVVLIMPMLVLGILTVVMEVVPRYEVLKDFRVAVVGIPFMIELFVIMSILYQMYKRLNTHSKRDRKWRAALIEFEDRVGADSSDLRSLDKTIGFRETFALKPYIVLLMVTMFIFDALLFTVFIPQWHHDNTDYTAWIMYIGIGLCIAEAVLIAYSVMTFAYRHEKKQNEFTILLSSDLAKVGIEVPPMIKIVRHHNIIVHIILMILTAGIWGIYLIYMMFQNMNNHLMNQWVYESEMYKVVESNGRMKFEHYMKDYHCSFDLSKRQAKRLNKRNFKKIRTKVKADNEMPKILMIAELFLIFLCANYILKIIALDCEICDNYALYNLSILHPETFLHLHRQQAFNLVMVVVDMFFLLTTIASMLGIASRRPASWRQVVRSCVTFVIPLWLSTYLTSSSGLTHIFDMNVYISTGVLVVILIMMVFAPSIREFYAPVGSDMPTTGDWIKYAFFGKLSGRDLDYKVDIDEIDSLDYEDIIPKS